MLAVFYFAYTVFFFAVFDRFELLHNADARQMALIVNIPENMKGRRPSWSKQCILILAQVIF
jgi:hypothetical protein